VTAAGCLVMASLVGMLAVGDPSGGPSAMADPASGPNRDGRGGAAGRVSARLGPAATANPGDAS
jgi:hypothetical protein